LQWYFGQAITKNHMISEIDQSITLFLNGIHSPFFDRVMIWITTQETWYILYLFILIILGIKQGKGFLLTIFLIALLITLADQTSSGILKPTVKRLRPCHDPELKEMIHNPDGCGGQYGFTSSHASNHFAVAFFLFPLFRPLSKWAWLLFPWAIVVAYSRIYLGVHFFGDILVGSLIGSVFGVMVYKLGVFLSEKLNLKFKFD
jgi:undecaprenyl-diphosphatase